MTNADLTTMTNAQTISKLNEALTNLIKAYKELEDKNASLKNRIKELEEDVFNLELAKEELENSVNEFKSNTEDDKTHIYAMLGEIENILKKDSTSTNSFQNVNQNSSLIDGQDTASNLNEDKYETYEKESSNEDQSILNFTYKKDESVANTTQEDSNKLNLSDPRLDSLLKI